MSPVKKAQKRSLIKPWMLFPGVFLLLVILLSGRNPAFFLVLFFLFIPVFFLWFFFAGLQSFLPVSSFDEVLPTMKIVFAHAWGRPLRLARVVGGQLVSPEDKFYRAHRRSRIQKDVEQQLGSVPGVILQDFNSAAVLEKMSVIPSPLSALMQRLLHPGEDHEPPLRICGPGLIFIRPLERVHSFIDLRKQIRSEKDVTAFTGDGIEIKSFVFSLFSVGLQPKPLQLAYNGGLCEEDLQSVFLRKENGRLVVQKFVDDLEADDRHEAHDYLQGSVQLNPYFAPEDPGSRPVYDEKRVFGAVYARARVGSSDLMRWDELPLIFSKDAFKEMASQFNFDELSNHLGASRLLEFKDRVNAAVRNQGLMTYSVVQHRSGQPLQVGESYVRADLVSTPVRSFTTPKVLRERGIMIVRSAFATVTPLKEGIYKQRLENWQVLLQRDINMVTARRELEVRNIYSRARSQAQQELSCALQEILKDRQYSEEAMALLVFQALEEFASNPDTRQRLPGEVITLLRNVHDRILPPDAGSFPFMRE